MIDSSFWALWKFILRQGVSSVDSFDVVLRAPTITPPGESPVDPATLSPSSGASTVKSVRSALSVEAAKLEEAFDEPVPLTPVRLPEAAQSNVSLSSRGGRSGSIASIRELSGRLRERVSRSRNRAQG